MNFTEILAQRGRVLVFTPTAAISLPLEAMAERAHMAVVMTRGWADKYAPLLYWGRICKAREPGAIFMDQVTYTKNPLACTDVVWIGAPTAESTVVMDADRYHIGVRLHFLNERGE